MDGQFLTNRSQSVYVNEHPSSLSHIKSSVPQGSVLGSILTLIYVNDIENTVFYYQVICKRLASADKLLTPKVRTHYS